MEGIHNQERPRRSRLARTIGVAVLLGAGFAGGVYYERRGSPQASLEEIAKHPPASGTLDLSPVATHGNYVLDWRLNSQGEREAYLQDRSAKVEWRIPEAAPDLFTSYLGNGKYAMEGMMKTIALMRKAYSVVGTPEEPQPIKEKTE
jgi:hypothetical protein